MNKTRKDRKNLLIGILCMLICMMSLGYAVMIKNVRIEGSAGASPTWNVHISNVTCTSTPALANNPITISNTHTNDLASFSVGFHSPGDKAVCEVTVLNEGTLVARAKGVAINNAETLNTKPIVVTMDGIVGDSSSDLKNGTKLLPNQTNTFSITMTYDGTVELNEYNKQKVINVYFTYEQDL